MAPTTGNPAPLRERKQQRAREAIVKAAYELFAERGFDDVTVSEIAERAEVGRTTFFRYFSDKQEVPFADDADVLAKLIEQIRQQAELVRPIGDSLPIALQVLRGALATPIADWSAHPERLATQAQLLARHPDLHARHLLKQQRQARELAGVLVDYAATPVTAHLATQLALACLHAAAQLADVDTGDEPDTIDALFSRLQAAAP